MRDRQEAAAGDTHQQGQIWCGTKRSESGLSNCFQSVTVIGRSSVSGRCARGVAAAAALLVLPGAVCAQSTTVGVSAHSLDPAQAPRYAAAGARVVRLDLPFTHVMHADREAWGPFDAVVATLQAQGITPLLIAHYDRNGAAGFRGEDDVQAYARFVGAAARRYPAALIEIGNEVNLTPADTGVEGWIYVAPETYAAAALAVRAAAPRARLIGPGIGGGTCAPGLEWLRRAAAAGALEALDAVSVHPYCTGAPEGLSGYLADVRAISGGVPVVVSEWGFSAPDAEQSDLVARALRAGDAAGLPLLVLYRWAPGDADFSLTRADGSARPALAHLAR